MIHDVDLLPADSVDYGACERPTQLSSEIDCWGGAVPSAARSLYSS